MRIAKIFLLAALIFATPAFAADSAAVLELPEERFSKWLGFEDFKEFSSALDKGGFYPIWLEGRLKEGVEEYRVAFDRRPLKGKLYYYYWFDMDEEFYNSRLKDMTEKGFDQISIQQFNDAKGQVRFQSVWRKFSDP